MVTIVNTDGHLRAYNTDYLAIAKLLADHQIPVEHTFAVLGSGGHGQGRQHRTLPLRSS